MEFKAETEIKVNKVAGVDEACDVYAAKAAAYDTYRFDSPGWTEIAPFMKDCEGKKVLDLGYVWRAAAEEAGDQGKGGRGGGICVCGRYIEKCSAVRGKFPHPPRPPRVSKNTLSI